jgi:hypothetical protein
LTDRSRHYFGSRVLGLVDFHAQATLLTWNCHHISETLLALICHPDHSSPGFASVQSLKVAQSDNAPLSVQPSIYAKPSPL